MAKGFDRASIEAGLASVESVLACQAEGSPTWQAAQQQRRMLLAALAELTAPVRRLPAPETANRPTHCPECRRRYPRPSKAKRIENFWRAVSEAAAWQAPDWPCRNPLFAMPPLAVDDDEEPLSDEERAWRPLNVVLTASRTTQDDKGQYVEDGAAVVPLVVQVCGRWKRRPRQAALAAGKAA